MTQVLIVGVCPKTRYAIRQALGHQQIDIAGILDAGDPESLRYGLFADSGPAPFKGSIEVGGESVTLSGRYGRGGLRHDTIALLRGDSPRSLAAAKAVDVVLLAEHWSAPLPPALLDGDPVVVRFGVPAEAAPESVIPVPAAHLTAVACLVGALRPLSEIESAGFTTVGLSGPSENDRGRLLALRGASGGPCAQPSAAALPGVDPSLPVLGTEILGLPSEVTTTTVFLTMATGTDVSQVLRRLKSETRAALKGVLETRPDPVRGNDAVGSPAAVVDASSVTVHGRVVGLTVYTHTRSFEAARACELLSSPGRPVLWA